MMVYLFNKMASDNIGDQLIGFVISLFLTDAGFEVNNNRIYSLDKGVINALIIHLQSYFNDIKSICNCDTVIIGGGNLIMDTPPLKFRRAFHHFWLAILTIIFRKKYYYLSVGATPLVHKISKLLYRFVIINAKKVSVRDNYSKLYLNQLISGRDIEVLKDPVLALSSIYPRNVKPKDVNIGICPVQLFPFIRPDRALQKPYVDLHVKLVQYFLQENKRVHLFLNDIRADEQVLHDILEQISPLSPNLNIYYSFSNLHEYINFVTSLDFLFSSRLHAIVCATSYGIPSVGFGWQPKMKNFFQEQNLWGYIDILKELHEELPDDILRKALNYYIQKRNQPVQISDHDCIKSKIYQFLEIGTSEIT
jgi:polysaccharide pyruvyl transferase WcaK-like protein